MNTSDTIYYVNSYLYLLEHLRYHGGYETELPSLTVTFVIPDMEQEHLLFYIYYSIEHRYCTQCTAYKLL